MGTNKTISSLLAGLVLTLSLIGFGSYLPPATASQPVAVSQQSASSKIMPELADELATNPARLEYLLVLQEQTDTSNTISPLKWGEKGWYVYNKLRETAERTQAPLRRVVASLGVQQARVLRSFYIINALLVEGTPQSVYALADQPAVAVIYSNQPQQLSSPDQISGSAPSSSDPATIEYNMLMINAPQVWAQGNLGQGVTIGVNDRGAYYTHPAIASRWRGAGAIPGPDYNWHDAVNERNLEPYEEVGGGTGTGAVSLLVGEEPNGNRIGVVPQATWIACKMIDQDFSSSPEIIIECLEWMLAPTDAKNQNPDPALRPQVVNNSWGWMSAPNCNYIFQSAVQAWVAAGMYPVFPAGNGGHFSASLNRSPGNYPESRTTGGLYENGTISFLSSSGPSYCEPSVLLPLLVGPGDSNRAATTGGNQYSFYSGTGAATVHQSGVAAMLLHKNPALTISETTYYLTSTAHFTASWAAGKPPLGGPRPNNVYGWGLLDAEAAVNAVPALPATATPTITLTLRPTRTASNTSTLTATRTPTNTPTPPSTSTRTSTNTSTATAESSGTPTSVLTNTSTNVPASTATNTAMSIATPQQTLTPTSTVTSSATGTSAPSPSVCQISFTDVVSTNIFYADILALACRGVINGYSNGNGTFRFEPSNFSTRAQFTKMVVLGFGLPPRTPAQARFSDVPVGSFYYPYVEGAVAAGVVNGLGPDRCRQLATVYPCFGPDLWISRAEAAVLIQRVRNYPVSTPATATFADLPPGIFAYVEVETLYQRGVVSGGYCNGSSGSRCYFPAQSIQRGELSRILRRSLDLLP